MNTSNEASDALGTMLRAPGTILRGVALLLAIAAMIMPGFIEAVAGLSAPLLLPTAQPLTIALPVGVVIALLAGAIPALGSFQRLLDLMVAIIGAIIIVAMIFWLFDSPTRSVVGSKNYTVVFGLGGYAAVAATACMLLAGLLPRPRS